MAPEPAIAAGGSSPAPLPAPGEGPAAESGAPLSRSIVPLFVTPFVIIAPLVVLGAALLILFAARERTAPENLDRVLRGGANERWQAAYELQRQLQDSSSAWRADGPFVEKLLAAFARARDDDPRVREFLAASLGYLRDPRAVPALLGGLEDPGKDEEGRVRIAIVQALKSVGDPAAIPPLAEILRGSSDAGLRMAAANALGSLPGEGSVEALEAALADPEIWVRRNAALSLSAHRRGERAVPHLLEMLDPSNLSFAPDPDGELRRQALGSAIEAVAALGESSALSLLENLAASDPDPRVQNAALKALERLRQPPRAR